MLQESSGSLERVADVVLDQQDSDNGSGSSVYIDQETQQFKGLSERADGHAESAQVHGDRILGNVQGRDEAECTASSELFVDQPSSNSSPRESSAFLIDSRDGDLEDGTEQLSSRVPIERYASHPDLQATTSNSLASLESTTGPHVTANAAQEDTGMYSFPVISLSVTLAADDEDEISISNELLNEEQESLEQERLEMERRMSVLEESTVEGTQELERLRAIAGAGLLDHEDITATMKAPPGGGDIDPMGTLKADDPLEPPDHETKDLFITSKDRTDPLDSEETSASVPNSEAISVNVPSPKRAVRESLQLSSRPPVSSGKSRQPRAPSKARTTPPSYRRASSTFTLESPNFLKVELAPPSPNLAPLDLPPPHDPTTTDDRERSPPSPDSAELALLTSMEHELSSLKSAIVTQRDEHAVLVNRLETFKPARDAAVRQLRGVRNQHRNIQDRVRKLAAYLIDELPLQLESERARANQNREKVLLAIREAEHAPPPDIGTDEEWKRKIQPLRDNLVRVKAEQEHWQKSQDAVRTELEVVENDVNVEKERYKVLRADAEVLLQARQQREQAQKDYEASLFTENFTELKYLRPQGERPDFAIAEMETFVAAGKNLSKVPDFAQALNVHHVSLENNAISNLKGLERLNILKTLNIK
ncbi:hypothetical protein HDU93_003394, partial [Gonapodya sp. JEL0774]